MGIDVQKAGIWKRMAAWLLDIILMAVLAVGAAYLLSVALGYDALSTKLEQHYADYESRYGVVFDISQQDYEAMTEEQRSAYDAAYEALVADEEVLFTYDKVVNTILLITSLGILISMLLLEFVVPLLLKNGQTVGKKCFGIGLIRNDGVQMNNLQLFTRVLLGKYTIGTMLPVYVALLMLLGNIGVFGTVILGGLLVGQVICMSVTRHGCAIHDLLAGTVVVDIASQQIFRSSEELIEYTRRIHEDRAKRQDY